MKPQGVEVSGGDNLYARWNEGVSDVMGYLGIDASKDFTVNGMKYSKNGNGWFESQADSEAKSAYEMLKANNITENKYIPRKFAGDIFILFTLP